jgi:hypothetical protein
MQQEHTQLAAATAGKGDRQQSQAEFGRVREQACIPAQLADVGRRANGSAAGLGDFFGDMIMTAHMYAGTTMWCGRQLNATLLMMHSSVATLLRCRVGVNVLIVLQLSSP